MSADTFQHGEEMIVLSGYTNLDFEQEIFTTHVIPINHLSSWTEMARVSDKWLSFRASLGDSSLQSSVVLISYIADDSSIEEETSRPELLLNWVQSAEQSEAIDAERIVSALLLGAREEQFEVGMYSDFSSRLDEVFRTNPQRTISALEMNFDTEKDEVIAEALRWASSQDDTSYRVLVTNLLEGCLTHESALVRDTAALGLADLLGKDAVGVLRLTFERELVPELKNDIGDLIGSLENLVE